jgi:UDP-2,3-diacylglucosamine pyrophosphatase LpxH
LLIIVSDIHLGDGTCGKPITPGAFQLFADRLKELARNASQRADGKYRLVKTMDILMLGDILDPLQSTLWLEKGPGEPGYVRPWTDFHAPEYAAKLGEITNAILKHNQESIAILKDLTQESITLPPATVRGKVDKNAHEIPVKVRLHYMVGNHDWYYHLPGPAFDNIRAVIVEAFGLSNSPKPFPHELKESAKLSTLLNRYKVYARHGDVYDSFNYCKEKGRNAPSLGDAFAVEILNRFPVEVERRLGNELPPKFVESLRELVNIRPVLATPLWISSQMRQNNVPAAEQKKLKDLWDEMSNEFLKLKFVQESNIPFKLDAVDGLEMAIRLTDRFSFRTIDRLVVWIRKKFGSEEITFASHALKEEAFLNHTAQFVVYGHTHHHEVVPLDSFPGALRPTNQMYFNSGTWHPYYDLAINKPEEQKFIPYQVQTYLSFYENNERLGRRFETWSGSFSD